MRLPAGDGLDLQSQEDNIIDQTVRELDEFKLEGDEDETAPTGDSAEEKDSNEDQDYGPEHNSMRM